MGAIVVVASVGMPEGAKVSPVGAHVVAHGGAQGSYSAPRRQKQSLETDSHPIRGTAVTTSTSTTNVSLFIANFSAQVNPSITGTVSFRTSNKTVPISHILQCSCSEITVLHGLLKIYTAFRDVQMQQLIFLPIVFLLLNPPCLKNATFQQPSSRIMKTSRHGRGRHADVRLKRSSPCEIRGDGYCDENIGDSGDEHLGGCAGASCTAISIVSDRHGNSNRAAREPRAVTGDPRVRKPTARRNLAGLGKAHRVPPVGREPAA